jgi:hypothetical protein
MHALPPERLREETGARSGRVLDGVSAPPIVNETKLRIIAEMGKRGQPVSAAELYALWDGSKKLSVFDFHLSTLVRAGIAELVSGPELRFRLAEEINVEGHELMFRESYRSLAELLYG